VIRKGDPKWVAIKWTDMHERTLDKLFELEEFAETLYELDLHGPVMAMQILERVVGKILTQHAVN